MPIEKPEEVKNLKFLICRKAQIFFAYMEKIQHGSWMELFGLIIAVLHRNKWDGDCRKMKGWMQLETHPRNLLVVCMTRILQR